MYLAIIILLVSTAVITTSIVLTAEKCPTQEKWSIRGKEFKCKTENNETYHWILNVDDKLVETCMKRRQFYANGGSCPWVYTVGSTDILFGQPLTVCQLPGCPSSNISQFFYSDELYKYPECLVPPALRNNSSHSNEYPSANQQKPCPKASSAGLAIAITFAVIGKFTSFILCFRMHRRRRRSRFNNSNFDDK